MKNATGRVLKSDDVIHEGRFCLGPGQSISGQNNRESTNMEPQVRILETQNEYALISFTCSCGRQTLVRCEYTQTENKINAGI
jgi:hypothetical protein